MTSGRAEPPVALSGLPEPRAEVVEPLEGCRPASPRAAVWRRRPFAAHVARAPQAEASEAQRRFDDPEHGFDGLLAQGVAFAPGFGRQTVRGAAFGLFVGGLLLVAPLLLRALSATVFMNKG